MIKEMAPTPTKDEQIAYGVNMLTQAFAELHHATGEKKYTQYAGIAASWHTGNNDANFPMYDPETGRGYDGLNGVTGKVNMNSGAESTIEALMTIQAIQQMPAAMDIFNVKTTKRHTSTIHEAESFTVKYGSPTIETPESAWTGDALFSNKIVKMNNNDTIQQEINIEKQGKYFIYAALEKAPSLGEDLKVYLHIDGRKVSSTNVSAENKYLTLVNLNRWNYLTSGKHTILLTAKTPSNETITLDNVVVQPVNEYALFENEEGMFKLERNLLMRTNKLK